MSKTFRFRLRVSRDVVNEVKGELSYSVFFRSIIEDALTDFDSVEHVLTQPYSSGGDIHGVNMYRSLWVKLCGVCEARGISTGTFIKLAVEQYFLSIRSQSDSARFLH